MSDVNDVKKSGWKELFDTLIPQKMVSAIDIAGMTHTATAILPARKQQQVVNMLLSILDLPAIDIEGLKKLADAESPAQQVGMLIATIRSTLVDDDVLRCITSAVHIAYPSIVDAAIENVRETMPHVLNGIDKPDAADVMEADQLLGILLPFVSRLLGGINQKMISFQNQPSQKILRE